jgi:lysozyme
MHPLIKKHEGRKLTAYLCPAQKWTIGYGNTYHLDGTPVKKGDTITPEQADQYLEITVGRIKAGLKSFNLDLTPNQTDAVVSFIYNVGIGAFANSTLLKKMRVNPNDPTIRNEFMKWNKAGGKVLNGLVRRRTDEANLYFTP